MTGAEARAARAARHPSSPAKVAARRNAEIEMCAREQAFLRLLRADDYDAAAAALVMSPEERARWAAPDPVQDAAADLEREARGTPESMRGRK